MTSTMSSGLPIAVGPSIQPTIKEEGEGVPLKAPSNVATPPTAATGFGTASIEEEVATEHSTAGVNINHTSGDVKLEPVSPGPSGASQTADHPRVTNTEQSLPQTSTAQKFSSIPTRRESTSSVTVSHTDERIILSIPAYRVRTLVPGNPIHGTSTTSHAGAGSPEVELSPPPSTPIEAPIQTAQADNDAIDPRTQDLIEALSSGPPARSLRPARRLTMHTSSAHICASPSHQRARQALYVREVQRPAKLPGAHLCFRRLVSPPCPKALPHCCTFPSLAPSSQPS